MEICHNIERSLVKEIKLTINLNEINDTISKYIVDDAFAVIWEMHRVVWGKFINNEFHIFASDDDKIFWQEFRIFNANSEVYLQKNGDKFTGRVLIDNEGEETPHIDAVSRFFGEAKSLNNSDSEVIELADNSRKIFMDIPKISEESKYYGLLTRNYIGADSSTGLSGYVDSRFVSIKAMKRGE